MLKMALSHTPHIIYIAIGIAIALRCVEANVKRVFMFGTLNVRAYGISLA